MKQEMKKRWAKVIVSAGCMFVLAAGSVWAAPENAASPRASVAAATEDELSAKQAEIDAYVFGTGQEDIAEQGFSITHTGVVGGMVEVGITPYDETYADFLYEKFGRELVVVVEGEQAVLFGAADGTAQAGDAGAAGAAGQAAAGTAQIDGTADAVQAAAAADAGAGASGQSPNVILLALVAAAALVAGLLFAARKKLFTRGS